MSLLKLLKSVAQMVAIPKGGVRFRAKPFFAIAVGALQSLMVNKNEQVLIFLHPSFASHVSL